MEPDLVYIYPHTRVHSLINILRTTTHHAFPVVTETTPRLKVKRSADAVTSRNMMFKVRYAARVDPLCSANLVL